MVPYEINTLPMTGSDALAVQWVGKSIIVNAFARIANQYLNRSVRFAGVFALTCAGIGLAYFIFD